MLLSPLVGLGAVIGAYIILTILSYLFQFIERSLKWTEGLTYSLKGEPWYSGFRIAGAIIYILILALVISIIGAIGSCIIGGPI